MIRNDVEFRRELEKIVVKLDRATLINYIEFLKSSYLLAEVLKFAGIKEQIKAKKKFLSIDQGLRNAVLKEYVLNIITSWTLFNVIKYHNIVDFTYPSLIDPVTFSVSNIYIFL